VCSYLVLHFRFIPLIIKLSSSLSSSLFPSASTSHLYSSQHHCLPPLFPHTHSLSLHSYPVMPLLLTPPPPSRTLLVNVLIFYSPQPRLLILSPMSSTSTAHALSPQPHCRTARDLLTLTHRYINQFAQNDMYFFIIDKNGEFMCCTGGEKTMRCTHTQQCRLKKHETQTQYCRQIR
jgi:hypothetical protein